MTVQPSGSARVSHDCNRLRMAIAIDEEAVRLRLRHPPRHGHGFGGSGRLVEQRGVGDLEPRQIDDHGLEIQQGLEPPLADLRLIRRIGRVPGRIFQHVALDDGGQMRAVIALADQRDHRAVARCHVAHLRQQLRLRQRRTEIERLAPGGYRRGSSRRSGRRVSALRRPATCAGRRPPTDPDAGSGIGKDRMTSRRPCAAPRYFASAEIGRHVAHPSSAL